MKKILVLTLVATFLLGSLAFAAAKQPAGSGKAAAMKAGTGDVTTECQDYARKEMITSDRKDDFMKQCTEKLQMERKGDVNYPAAGKISEGKNTKPAAKQ